MAGTDHSLIIVTVKTEIQTGTILSEIALSTNDPDKAARNRDNAQLAYVTAKRWARQLDPAENKELESAFDLLRANLEKLNKNKKKRKPRSRPRAARN